MASKKQDQPWVVEKRRPTLVPFEAHRNDEPRSKDMRQKNKKAAPSAAFSCVSTTHPQSIPNFFNLYRSARNVIPNFFAAAVLLYRDSSSALMIAVRSRLLM